MSGNSPVTEFEQLWSGDSPPDVFAYLTNANVTNNRQLTDILLCDQYQRWNSDAAIPVEKYFEACPELDANEELKIELIAEEFGYQEQTGEPPELDQFLKRFSFLSDSALDQLRDSISEETSNLESPQLPFPAAPFDRDVATPEKISRFKIIETVGRGAFGVVYKGRDEELQRMVAIKVPTQSRIKNAGGTEAFLKEARVVAALDHPSIVPLYDVGTTDDGNCYLVSKFVDGDDLKARLKFPFSFSGAASLASRIAKALHHAHKEGLVHRDVKPGNILLDKEEQPYLVDFGLALRDEDYGHGAALVGTPAYMSPEQAGGKANRVDARSDIYSLGVVLFEMLTGERPYRASSPDKIIEQIKRGEVRPPRQIDDSIPQELDRICLKAMAHKPRERYSTALDFAIDLDQFCDSSDAMGGRSINASETMPVSADASKRMGSEVSTSSLSDSASQESGASSLSTSQVGQQSRLLPIVALVTSLLAIGVAVYLGIRQGQSQIEPKTPEHVRTAEEVPAGGLSAEQVVQRQLDTASELSIPAELRLADRLVLKLIPAGSFQMGSARDEIELLPLEDWFFKKWQKERMYHEAPRHVVEISKPFYMGAHEVTIEQFRRFVDSTDYQTTAETDPEGGYGWKDGLWTQDPEFSWKNVGFEQGDDHPVCNVSWDDATEYCRWLSTEENATFRLPTEAEWEYACRAGTTTWFHNGDRDEALKLVANIADQSLSKISGIVEWGRSWDDGFPFTAPVGKFQPNPWGLFDMHGNAWEWCHDWYGEKFYVNSPAQDPIGPELEELEIESAKERIKDIEEARKDYEKSQSERDKRRLQFYEQREPDNQYHVFRGGGWDNYPGFCRSADRYSSHSPRLRTQWAGFRVVRELDP